MRKINYIVVHCTATQPTATVDAIQKFWKEVRKWDKPGYHYLILRSGVVMQLLTEDEIAYGAYGHNQECIHLSYIGGMDEKGNPLDNRSIQQKDAMYSKLMDLKKRFPDAEILGHRDFPNVHKACPSFDVKEWLRNYQPQFKQAA